jgi:hypothetical protein
VNNPDAASVNQARRDILNAIQPDGSAGSLKVEQERASTLREVGAKLKVVVKGSAFGVDANATLDQTYKRNVVVALIRQMFYVVTFTPHGPGGGEATLPPLPPRSPTACAPSRCPPQGPPPDAGSPLEPQAQPVCTTTVGGTRPERGRRFAADGFGPGLSALSLASDKMGVR